MSAHLSTLRRGWEQAEREWATAFRREGYDPARAADGYEQAAKLLERADRGGWEWSPLAWIVRAEALGYLGSGERITAATLRHRGEACRARVAA